MCIYYGINGAAPITEPVLVLNGENRLAVDALSVAEEDFPVVINNVCFPNQVPQLNPR